MAGEGLGPRWPVVGADAAVAEVRRALADPGLGCLVLTGPAGVGKTALARAVLAAAADDGAPGLHVVASLGMVDRPFGALGSLVHVDRGPVVPATAGSGAPGPAAGPHIGGIDRRPGDPRRLLVVDDLPLLDPESAGEVARLVRRDAVVVLATARAGTALPSAFDGLAVEGRLAEQEVAPLGAAALARAAEVALGAPLGPDALSAILARSGGIPLHARELVVANTAAGRLVRDGPVWALDGDLLAPPSLFDLVASRFVRLDEADRRSVEALCLAQPLPVEAAATLVGLDVLVALERNDLVAVTDEVGSSVVRLAHPLYEESVRASRQPLRLRAAAQRAVTALGPAAAVDADLAFRLACLCVDHELPIDDAAALVAAQRALGLLDPARAERLVAMVAERSVDALLLLGAALSAQGRTGEADLVLAEAWAGAASDEQRARVLSRRAGNLGPGAGRFDEAVRLLEEGRDLVADARWRAFLEADLAYVRSWAGGRPRRAAPTSGAEAAGPVRANECLVGAVIAAMAGELDRAEDLVAEGLPLVATIARDVPHARDLLVLSRFLARAFGGDAAGARAVADGELARARSSSSGAAGIWLSARSLQALVAGDATSALVDAAEAADRLVLGDVAGMRPLAHAVRAVASARLGDLDASRRAAAAVDPSWRDEVKVEMLLTQAAGWQEVAVGRVDAGVELLAAAGRVGLAGHHLPLGALAAYDAVRLGRGRAVLDVLRSIVGGWHGPMGRTVLAHAELSVARPRDRDLEALVAVAGALPGLGLPLASAAAWDDVAEAATAQGRADIARRARLARARVEVADRGTPRGPAPDGLTPREREVARAVAEGRSSREVADVLGRSVRTVDNHLASVYRKLGVSGRQELAALLDLLGP